MLIILHFLVYYIYHISYIVVMLNYKASCTMMLNKIVNFILYLLYIIYFIIFIALIHFISSYTNYIVFYRLLCI